MKLLGLERGQPKLAKHAKNEWGGVVIIPTAPALGLSSTTQSSKQLSHIKGVLYRKCFS